MSTDEVTELRSQLALLTERLDELESERSDVAVAEATSTLPATAVSRRNWMKSAAVAAVAGTAVAVSGARPAAAAAGDPIVLGQFNTSATGTRSDYTGTDEGVGFLFQSGSGLSTGATDRGGAIGGVTGNPLQPNGLYGYSTVDAADTVVDADSIQAGAAGVFGHATGVGSYGVRAMSDQATGVEAIGKRYGAVISGELAAAALAPTTFEFPQDSTDFHQGGELYVRAASDSGLAVELFYCTVGGTPGSWVQLAGPFQPGGFRAIDPSRCYDSRVLAPTPGRLAAGDKRVVDLTQSRDLETGAPTGPLVPEGATAVAFNITVINTAASGFLSVVPGAAATEFNAATANWASNGQILNNGSVVQVFNDRQVSVFAGGAGSAHFTIDVTGYWV